MGRARNINVTCAAPIPVATDGEVIATDARSVSVETFPGAIEVLV
jgi:diacylglycerol kinase family enzyme